MGVFALEFTVRRQSSFLSKSDSLTIDTIQVADSFRTAAVDVAGVVAERPTTGKTKVYVVFTADEFHIDIIDQTLAALRRHVDGGDVDPNGIEVHTAPDRSVPGDPERVEDLVVRWD